MPPSNKHELLLGDAITNAAIARVLREVADCWDKHKSGHRPLFDYALRARAAELDKNAKPLVAQSLKDAINSMHEPYAPLNNKNATPQKMPGVLDIPGVKDYVNATPPRVAPCPICGSTNNVHTHLDNVADRRNDAIANAVQIAMVKNATHVHTDDCWEPDSGCDMGRNPNFCARSLKDRQRNSTSPNAGSSPAERANVPAACLDPSITAASSNEGAGGSGQAAGLCTRCGGKDGQHSPLCMRAAGLHRTAWGTTETCTHQPAAPSTNAALDETPPVQFKTCPNCKAYTDLSAHACRREGGVCTISDIDEARGAAGPEVECKHGPWLDALRRMYASACYDGVGQDFLTILSHIRQQAERIAELESSRNTLDIPGVKDYVNAAPPSLAPHNNAAPSQEGAGGSGPAAGLTNDDGERLAYCLMQMMQAYERRIRSDCTTPEQIAKRPWECMEYLDAAKWLRRLFPQTIRVPDDLPAAPSPDAALDEAMEWLEDRARGVGTIELAATTTPKAIAILSHIRKQATRIAELTQQVRNLEDANTRNYNRQLADDKERDALRARVAELEAEKERDEVSDWMRACAAQGEQIATLRAENERKDKALAAADVVCHTLFHGGPDNENAAVLDDYWHARGGMDACTVCNPSAPKDEP